MKPTLSSGYGSAEMATDQNDFAPSSIQTLVVHEGSRLQLQPFEEEAGDNETNCINNMTKRLRQVRILLYLSHFFSEFAEGAWQFAVILFLAAITEYKSILLVSTYYLATYAAVCVAGSPLGRYVDCANRLSAARVCIVIENVSVLVATVCCAWLLTNKGHYGDEDPSTGKETGMDDTNDNGIPTDTLSLVLLVGIHVFGSIAQVLDQTFVVAIERDWIVVMSEQLKTPQRDDDDIKAATSESWLSSTNVALRQIDLTCRVFAPAVTGLIVGSAGAPTTIKDATRIGDQGGATQSQYWHDLFRAAVLVGFVNVTALLVEYICTAHIYHLVPALSERQETGDQKNRNDETVIPDTTKGEEAEHATLLQQKVSTTSSSDDSSSSSMWQGLKVYMQQPVKWAGLSLAAIYLNAMSFGGIMTAYLLWKGMSVEEVGLWRSVSSVTGLSGTFAYQILTRYTTVVNTGKISAWYLFGCLTLAVLSFWVHDNYNLSTYLLVISCAASRTGLWVFDITITLLYQEFVPDGVRGLVGGTQQALNSFFVILTSCLGLFFQRPEQFYVFAAASYTGVCIMTLLYTFGIARRRHLFKMAIDDL